MSRARIMMSMEVMRAMRATGARTVQNPTEGPTIATTETRDTVGLSRNLHALESGRLDRGKESRPA